MRLQSGHGAAGVGSLLLLLLFLSKGAVLSGLYDDDVDDEESFTLSAVGNEARSFDGTGGEPCCVLLLVLLESRVRGCD